MKLKGDKVLRDRFFTPESYLHPAKGHLGLWWEILERYTKPGEWVLDPMAGVGATMLGALLGRNIISVELEQHFVEPMRASWAKMRQHPMLGYDLGQVIILRGDARDLPLGRADAVITSPPYEQEHQGGPDTRPEAQQGGMAGRTAERYTRPVDAVVTSPPFGEAQSGGGIAAAMSGKGTYAVTTNLPGSVYNPESHNHSTENIGNLRSAAYWEAMRQVYSECHHCLKPGGLMVLVVGNYVRAGLIVDLVGATIIECERLGFRLFDRWEREKWSLSFWRILQARKGGPIINSESVIAFRRE